MQVRPSSDIAADNIAGGEKSLSQESRLRRRKKLNISLAEFVTLHMPFNDSVVRKEVENPM